MSNVTYTEYKPPTVRPHARSGGLEPAVASKDLYILNHPLSGCPHPLQLLDGCCPQTG